MKKLLALAAALVLTGNLFAQTEYTYNPANVTIVRDSFGVPHIFGVTDADAVYGLAWAHCEDNFNDVQKNFLPAKGKMGRAVGKDGLLFDFFAKFADVSNVVEQNYDAQISPEYKLLLNAYVKAVNTYATQHPKSVLVKGSFPINEKDIVKGYMLSFNLFTAMPYYLKIIFKNQMTGVQEKLPTGSNAFALKADMTSDSSTILLANPHNSFEGQYSWYEAHVISEQGLNMNGALFPGCITPTIGFNDSLGWTHTFNYHDLVDVYKLTINPKNKLQYKYDGKWLPMTREKVKLHVRILGKKGPVVAVSRKIFQTVYGPALKSKTGTFAVRWSGPANELRGGEQWYKMAKACNYKAWMDAVNMDAIPIMNFIYADRQDNIYFLSQAKIPVRKAGYNWLLVLPGDTSATMWNSFYPLSARPQILNPSCGYIYNTNNSPLRATGPDCDLPAKDYQTMFGIQVNPTNRSQRLDEILNNLKGRISMQTLKNIKYDTHYPANSILMDQVYKITSLNTDTLPKRIKLYIDGMRAWDRNADTSSVGAQLVLGMFKYLTKDIKVGMEEFFFREMAPPISSYLTAIKHSDHTLHKYYGTINVPLGQMQRHVRGNVSYPIGGMTDVLAALNCKYQKKKGYYKATSGDAYMLFLTMNKNGISAESIVPYGASNVPGNKHYADQMSLYLAGKAKKVLITRTEIYNNAEHIYHPGE